ncbi:peroxidase 59 [Quercus suber]|uniref:Peroxidase n=1 Tax=Quercus suber TaxID=58331 RepID=A0AAW0LX62_QUESU
MEKSMSFYGYSLIMTFFMLFLGARSQLTPNFYERTCPKLLSIVRNEVQKAFNKEIRMAASLLWLHFHDCFVNGCDGSLLLDVDDGEKFSLSNLNSEDLKFAVESECPDVISCADILAIAARDSVVITGGPAWTVLLGRRDGFVSIDKKATDDALPSAFDTLYNITFKFKKVGLDVTDVVSLSGSHTIGLARCAAFSNRLFNFENTGLPDRTLDRNMLSQLQGLCGNIGSYYSGYSADPNLGNATTFLDRDSTKVFDNHYFQNLLNRKALLSSDQVLLSSYETKRLVQDYSSSKDRFFEDFAESMVKMGNVSPLTGSRGEIRKNCRRVN